MPSKIRYEWTGVFRPPKKGEWYLYNGQPEQARCDYNQACYFILRRVEESEVDNEK